MGPVCRMNAKTKQQEDRQMDMFAGPRSDYTVAVVDGVICVVDLDCGGRSVTTDAAVVIAVLAADGIYVDGMPVIYRDSAGIWDQMLVRNGRFAGFAPISERDRDDAVGKVKRGGRGPRLAS